MQMLEVVLMDELEYGLGKEIIMRYAIIENNKIVNVAVADEPLATNWIKLENDFSIGDNYINGVFSKAEIAVEVPQTLTPRQIRIQLTNSGLRQQVEDIIANTDDYALKDWWEYSLDYKRDNPILIDMATQLGLTDEQIDDMFIQASKL